MTIDDLTITETDISVIITLMRIQIVIIWYTYHFKDQSETISNSINLTVILYRGFASPFIFGGVTRKDYTSTVTLGDQSSTQKFSMPIAPNFGAGISFKISRSFSFKITETLSPVFRPISTMKAKNKRKK